MRQSKVCKENLIALVIDEAHCVKLWYVYYDCMKDDQIKIFYRVDVFRKAFAEIGNLRSILPYNVNVMALTATATKQMVECVVERLCMKEPAIIEATVDRSNIKYFVKSKATQAELCTMLADKLLSLRENVKTVLFWLIVGIYIKG